MTWLMVALGGALGSVGRFGLGQALARFDSFPYGTLLANVLGSLIIGICAGLFDTEQRSRPVGLFLIAGFCGGFTTFSTFSLQTFELLEQQAWLKAGGNMFLSVVLCLLGAWLGFLLGQSLRKTA
jgi:CrcB protein